MSFGKRFIVKDCNDAHGQTRGESEQAYEKVVQAKNLLEISSNHFGRYDDIRYLVDINPALDAKNPDAWYLNPAVTMCESWR